MKTIQDLTTEGLAIASPNVFRHYTVTGGSLDLSERRARYGVGPIAQKKSDIKSKPFTYNAKDRYFIVGGTKTPYSNIKAYIQMAKGRITKDADKADHFVIDNTVFDTAVYFENCIETDNTSDTNETVLVSSDNKYPNWNSVFKLLVANKKVSDLADWNYVSKRVYDYKALAALAVIKNYSSKIVTPYDLGIATGSITDLTDDNIKAVIRMIGSSNSEDISLANHMISTFDYKSSELMTWKFCRELNVGGRVWYLNKRMKSIREFINEVYDKYSHLDVTDFFERCRRRESLTPEVFAYLHKDLQSKVRVLHNPDIWFVKFEMKDKYKNLLKENRNEKSKTNIGE